MKKRKINPLGKLSPAEIRRYAPTADAYWELIEQVSSAVSEALGVGDIEYDGEVIRYEQRTPDNTRLRDLWNNNPLARAFIETMIAMQSNLRGLIEEDKQNGRA